MTQEPRVIIEGRHIDLTEAIKNQVNEQIHRLYEHESHIELIRVEVGMESAHKSRKDEFTAKGHVAVKGNDLHVTCQGDNLYSAICEMAHKLDRMLRKRSANKLKKRHGPRAADIGSPLQDAV